MWRTQIYVLCDELLTASKTEQYISGNTGVSKTWRDIHQKILVLPEQSQGMPARRLLGLHASAAIDKALAHGWIRAEDEVQVADAALASEDFDRLHMEVYLNDQAVLNKAPSMPVSDTSANSSSAIWSEFAYIVCIYAVYM